MISCHHYNIMTRHLIIFIIITITSKDFRLFATTLSSSSNSRIFVSPT